MTKTRSRITVQLTAEELKHLREQAAAQRMTVSRFARDLLLEVEQAKDQQIVKLQRQIGGLQGDMRTVISMIDRLAELSSTPEDYKAWQKAVEAALRPQGHANGEAK